MNIENGTFMEHHRNANTFLSHLIRVLLHTSVQKYPSQSHGYDRLKQQNSTRLVQFNYFNQEK